MTFPFNKSDLTIRFCIDVYHMLFFLINGIFISDYYLANNFERYFTTKFMEYLKIEHPSMKNKIEPNNEGDLFSS